MISIPRFNKTSSLFNDSFFDSNLFERSSFRKHNSFNRMFDDDFFYNNNTFNRIKRKPPVQRQPFDVLDFESPFFEEFDAYYPWEKRINRKKPKKTFNKAKTPNCSCVDCLLVIESDKENCKPENKIQKKEKSSVPKQFSSTYSSNYVNNNGNSTRLDKRTVTNDNKNETFVTKITNNKEGNQIVEEINPESYNQELKEIHKIMEDNGAIIQEVNPFAIEPENIDNADDDDNKNTNCTISNVSNCNSRNNLFADILF